LLQRPTGAEFHTYTVYLRDKTTPPPLPTGGGVLGSISIFRPSPFLFLEYLERTFCLSRKCSEYAVKDDDRIRPLKGPQHEIFRRNLFNADSFVSVG
jgi:hypothetical protein